MAQPALYARTVCAGCPVREDCLQAAVLDGVEDGIWGGCGERTRRRLHLLLLTSPHPTKVTVPKCKCSFHRAWAEHFRRLDVLHATGEMAADQTNLNSAGAQHGKAATRGRGCKCVPCKHSRTKPGCDCPECAEARANPTYVGEVEGRPMTRRSSRQVREDEAS